MVKIGSDLIAAQKEEKIEFLYVFKYVYAWLYKDMPGLDTDVVVHRLPLKPECKPVKQKLRKMKHNVKKEVVTQYKTGFLEVVDYPEWLANIEPVPKKDVKV